MLLYSRYFAILGILIVLSFSCESFKLFTRKQVQRNVIKMNMNKFVSKAIIITSLMIQPLGSFSIASANIGEGGLPDGALAFSKLIKYQKDWNDLASSIEKRKDEIDDKEIINIKFFLKQLANEYFDMEVVIYHLLFIYLNE